MTRVKHIILTFCLIFISNIFIHAQISRTEMLGVYIYKFAELSSSPEQAKCKNYNIHLISDNQEIIELFETLSKTKKVNNKAISLSVSSDANINYDKLCLIFISREKLNYYDEIFEKTKQLPVLLVTENYTEKRKILLNIFDSKENGKLLFEINNANVYQRKIKMKDEVLLMGGTQIDLYKLYLDAQAQLKKSDQKLLWSEQKLKASESALKRAEQTLKNLDAQIVNAKEEAVRHKKEIALQKKMLKQQINDRQALLRDINRYKKQLKNQRKAIEESWEMLTQSYDSLLQTKAVLLKQRNEINEGKRILEHHKKEIEQKSKEISEKENILYLQNKTIYRQRIVVFTFIFIFTIIAVLVFLLIKSGKEKQKKNQALNKQRLEIIEKNKKLKNQNEEIQAINGELNEKNEELRSTLEEIKHMQKQLVQAEKMASLGILSAGIAHEINNPINFVYAGINSLLRDFEDIRPVIDAAVKIHPDAPDLREKIKEIRKLKEEYYFDEAYEAIPEIIADIKLGADRTAEIVKSLRNFSRSEEAGYQDLDIHEGIDTSLLLLKNKYKLNIEIIKNYGDDIPPLKCQAGKINQVFLNILSNAVDAVTGKGKIWISTKTESQNIIISIKDSGTGIPKEAMSKLFDPFYTTKPVGQGTGLGLSISYGIIKEHKGNITVKSKEGEGSEFIITLPINQKLLN